MKAVYTRAKRVVMHLIFNHLQRWIFKEKKFYFLKNVKRTDCTHIKIESIIVDINLQQINIYRTISKQGKKDFYVSIYQFLFNKLSIYFYFCTK